jgi:hypothetical protein
VSRRVRQSFQPRYRLTEMADRNRLANLGGTA